MYKVRCLTKFAETQANVGCMKYRKCKTVLESGWLNVTYEATDSPWEVGESHKQLQIKEWGQRDLFANFVDWMSA